MTNRLKNTLTAGAALGLTAAALTLATSAQAAEGPIQVQSTCNQGWYVNHDEGDRLPEQVKGGLEFEGDDLVHHTADTTVEDLEPGSFVASPAPDQNSFFSVEVYGDDGGYATLRWNTATSKWDMVTGGQLYSNADPAALVDMPTSHKSHKVVSFGVGYTANPPGTVTTMVSSITFDGKTYDLTCEPATQTPSATPSASVSVTPSTSVSPSASVSPTRTGSTSAAAPAPTQSTSSAGLPVTGAPARIGFIIGAVLVVVGGAAIVVGRRRRTKFEA